MLWKERTRFTLIIARAIRTLTKVVIHEEIVMVHGANTVTFLHSGATAQTIDKTLELGDQNLFFQYREFNFLYCLGTYFTLKKTVRDFDIRV